MKNILWDNDSKSIRGSFVNLLITFVILGLIIIACFNDTVCKNMNQLSSLIIGFFTISFGVWKVVGVIEKTTTTSNTNGSNTTTSIEKKS